MNKTLFMFRAVTAAVLFGSFAFSASAAVTLASWDGDFSVLTKDWITIDLQGNTVNDDGTITIGDRGLLLTRVGNNFSLAEASANYALTVILKVSNIPTDATSEGAGRKTLCVVQLEGGENCAVLESVSSGRLFAGWGTTSSGATSNSSIDDGEHIVAFGYRNKIGECAIVDGVQWASSGQWSSSNKLYPIRIGEYTDGTRVAAGMKIKGIAIVEGRLSAAEVQAYEWPKPQPSKYARFVERFSDRIMTLTSAGSTELSSTATFALFDPVGGTNTMTTFKGGTATTLLPGFSGSQQFWHGWANTTAVAGYVAPGLVLRIPIRSSSGPERVAGGFNPVTLGGLIVEANAATSTTLPGVWPSGTTSRTSELGNPAGSLPTWFILEDSFRLNRIGDVSIYGVINFDIAEGKRFTCEIENPSTKVELKANAKMQMHGAGTFQTGTLRASANPVTLDYSDLSLDRATPYIGGNLVISSSTRIALPAGALANGPYTLCSGTLTMESVPTTITIGGRDSADFAIEGNQVFAATSWTGAGENANWSNPGNWSAGVPGPGARASIPAGQTAVIDSGAELADVMFIGQGRVVYEGRLPGDEKAMFRNAVWAGTVEIRNYQTTEEIPFADYENAGSVVAFNGVTAPMKTGATFSTLEIDAGGWTTTADELAGSPVYSGQIIGEGVLTVAETGSGAINFIGADSSFAANITVDAAAKSVAFLPAGAQPVTTGSAGTIQIASGRTATVAAGRTWMAANGFEVVGFVNGEGALVGPVDFDGGAILPRSELVIEGALTNPTVDGSALVAAGQTGGRVMVRTTDKPEFTIRNAEGYRAFWHGDIFCLTTASEEALARYAHWIDYAPGLVTWTGNKDIHGNAASLVGFDPMTASDTAFTRTELAAGNTFCSGNAEFYIPGIGIRFAAGRGTPGVIDYASAFLSFGAILVDPGATGWEFKSLNNTYRHFFLGDKVGNAAETWTSINEDFTVNRGGETVIYGICNIEVASGKTFTLNVEKSTPEITVAQNAEVKFHGEGTFKVGKLVATGLAGLDFSDLAANRATPFVDGDIEIDRMTRLAFPAGLAAETAYPLCTGTLTAPAEPFLVRIRVGEEEKPVLLTVTDNTVSYVDCSAYEASLDGTYYETLQGALAAATPSSVIEVLKSCSAELTGAATLGKLALLAGVDAAITGTAALTLADGATLAVPVGQTLMLGAPVVLAGDSRETEKGKVVFNGSVTGCGTNAVCAGEVELNGAVTGNGTAGSVMICGRGASAADAALITLKGGCTVSDGALVTPAFDLTATCYGKVVQDGATVVAPSMGMMRPNGGDGRYVLNSGTFSSPNGGTKQIDLQNESGSKGGFYFEQNGGTVTVSKINMCRLRISNNFSSRFHYTLNGGTIIGGFTGATLNNPYTGFENVIRVELNGGTYVDKEAVLYTDTALWMVASGDVTIRTSGSQTVTVPAGFNGSGTLTFDGPGTLDLTAVTNYAGDYKVTGGALLLGGALLDETTTLWSVGTGKFGLAFEGVKDIKTYRVGSGRELTVGYEYGVNAHGASRFVATDPAGAVRLLEGQEPSGMVILLR